MLCKVTYCIMIWYGMIWYDMVWYGMVWYDMVWYGMIWYGMMWCDMIWYEGKHTLVYIWQHMRWNQRVIYYSWLLDILEEISAVVALNWLHLHTLLWEELQIDTIEIWLQGKRVNKDSSSLHLTTWSRRCCVMTWWSGSPTGQPSRIWQPTVGEKLFLLTFFTFSHSQNY